MPEVQVDVALHERGDRAFGGTAGAARMALAPRAERPDVDERDDGGA